MRIKHVIPAKAGIHTIMYLYRSRIKSGMTDGGFVAVTTVLIIISVILAVGTSVALLSIGEAQSSLVLYKGEDNLNFGEGCVEDVMLKIRSNSAAFPVGISTFTRPEGTCSINVVTANPNWDITVNSQTTIYQRKIRVQFTRNPTGITLTSWKEI